MKIPFCNKCDICLNNNFIPVSGKGNIKSAFFFIGEAPGQTEVKYNLPFVGKSGIKLNSYIQSNKLEHCSYITNCVKCRPSGNRTPFDKEIYNCNPYLRAELILGNPKIIILLGLTAIKTYFKVDIPKIGNLVNKPILHKHKIIIPTYHPSYIIRDKRKEIYYIELFKLLVYLKNKYYII